MAEYDGAIRIATKITTKDATESLASLEWQIKKSAKYMDELRSKMDTLKDQKIPTKDCKDLQDELFKAEKALSNLIAKQNEMEELGITSGDAWNALNEKIATASDNVDLIKEKMQLLVDAGKAFTLGQDTAEYKAMERQLQYEEEAVKKAAEHYNKLLKTSEVYKKIGETAKKTLNSIGNILKKTNSFINSFGKHIKETFSKITKSASGATKSANGISLSLKNILKYGFGIRSLYTLINKLRAAIIEGFTNLYNDKSMVAFKNSVDNLKASALTLKNAFAAAFSPFVEIAIPYIQRLLDYMTQLVNIAGQFFAAITGRKTYIRAIKQTTDVLEEETKAMNKQLSPLDKLNNLSSEKASKASVGSGGMMFEEVPIEGDILNIAEKIKDILSKIFKPLKEAWDRVGKQVIKAWKYALDEVWKLIKDIGRDLLKVWQEEATVKILENILHIIKDIGLVVGNLARNFREAWNENEVGLSILRKIRDIIGIIVKHIKNAADVTVEWSNELDFYPLLDAFNRFLESLEPAIDALSGILEDFYTMVLLPLGKWVLEEGLPQLLQVFIDFNNKVDWETLRTNLAKFWEHLEPFAETIGEGLILFIERISDALANFLNSQEFKDFLVSVENWMDKVTPEDVADGLTKLAEALIVLKVALAGFTVAKGLADIVTVFTKLVPLFKLLLKPVSALARGLWDIAKGGLSATGKVLTDIGSLIVSGISNGIAGAGGISGLLTADLGTLLTGGSVATAGVAIGGILLGGLAGVLGGGALGKLLDNYILAPLMSFDEELSNEYKNFKWFGENGFFARFKDSFSDDSWKDALKMWGQDIIDGIGTIFTDIGNAVFNFSTTLDLFEGAAEFFKNAKTAFENQDWIGLAEDIVMGIVGGLLGAISFLTEPIADIFNAIYKGICSLFGIHSPSTVMAEVGKNIMLGLLNGFKAIWTSITTWITEKIQWLSNKIKSISNMFSGISASAKSAVGTSAVGGGAGNFIGGLAGGNSRSVYSASNPAIANLSTVDFPAYATGQVIPRTMKQHLAILGDNSQETEVVSPLSTIEQAVINAMAKVNGGIGGSNRQELTLNLTVECEGYKLLQLIKKLDGEYFKQTGKHAMA